MHEMPDNVRDITPYVWLGFLVVGGIAYLIQAGIEHLIEKRRASRATQTKPDS